MAGPFLRCQTVRRASRRCCGWRSGWSGRSPGLYQLRLLGPPGAPQRCSLRLVQSFSRGFRVSAMPRRANPLRRGAGCCPSGRTVRVNWARPPVVDSCRLRRRSALP